MKKYLPMLILFFWGFAMESCKPTQNENTRTEKILTSGWRFAKNLTDEHIALPDYNDSVFQEVIIPHTANLEPLIVNNQWQGTSWYRKWLNFNEQQKNQKHFLYFEAAMQQTTVFFNGQKLAVHDGGYLPFLVDITGHIDFESPNLLAIKLVNTDDSLVPPGKPLKSLDFNMYGGIYRPVKLISTSKTYITHAMQSGTLEAGGVLVQFDSISSTHANLNVQVQVANDFGKNKVIRIEQTLRNAEHESVAHAVSDEIILPASNRLESQLKLSVDSPILWSPTNPYLYQLETEIFEGGLLLDHVVTAIGIRELQLTENGFFLNGKKTFLRGTNRHQEYPFIGYALSEEAQWREAYKIKEAGFDLVRLSHYPHSEAFMDACDELGIITMNCLPGWQYNGNAIFQEQVLENTRDLIRRDRNRPSVFFWELSLNESWMEPELMDRIIEVKDHEFKGQPAYTCSWIDYPAYDLFIPARQHGSPPSYWNNYKSGKRPVFIAEYGDWEYYAQNAGFNQSDFSDLQAEERTSRQLRGSGEKRLLQQALNYQEAANSNRKGASTIGHANWLMFDYNRGYSDDIEASGISDIFRIPKFAHYFYQSQRDADEPCKPPTNCGPMVFIASYWQPKSSTSIRVFSNCDEVELRLNGKTIAKQTPDKDANSTHLEHPPTTFYLDKFEPGQLSAFGYMDGKKVAGHWVRTPETPEQLSIDWDESHIPLSSNDVVFVYAQILDKNGTVCPENDTPITFQVDGNAELIGDNPVKSEAGIATILLKTNNANGQVFVSAQAEKLKSDTLSLTY